MDGLGPSPGAVVDAVEDVRESGSNPTVWVARSVVFDVLQLKVQWQKQALMIYPLGYQTYLIAFDLPFLIPFPHQRASSIGAA